MKRKSKLAVIVIAAVDRARVALINGAGAAAALATLRPPRRPAIEELRHL